MSGDMIRALSVINIYTLTATSDMNSRADDTRLDATKRSSDACDWTSL